MTCFWLAAFAKGDPVDPEILLHTGMAGASAAVAVSTNLALIANDDDNILRLYRADQPGPPVARYSLDRWFEPVGRSMEMDLEGGAKIANRIYWIGSHSNNKEGHPRPSRNILIATDIAWTPEGKLDLRPAGTPCRNLITQWLRDPRSKALFRSPALVRPPEDGGLNIEGLAAAPNGGLFIGLRGPLSDNKAILLTLLNPSDILNSKPASFGDPIVLDLGGLGVRDMVWTGSEWFLIGGPVGSGGKSRFFRWAGPGHRPEPQHHINLKHENPEGLAFFGTPESPKFLVVSDDGHLAAKELAEPLSFRSFWFEPNPIDKERKRGKR